jgi:hypothetical protein
MPAQIIAGFALLAALLATSMGWYASHVGEAIARFTVR